MKPLLLLALLACAGCDRGQPDRIGTIAPRDFTIEYLMFTNGAADVRCRLKEPLSVKRGEFVDYVKLIEENCPNGGREP